MIKSNKYHVLFLSVFILSCDGDKEFFRGFDNSLNQYSRFNLVIFISEDDCLACISELSVFNKLHADVASENLSLIGIIENKSTEEVNVLIRNGVIDFPVVSNTKIFNKYSSGLTPEALLVDMSRDQRIVFRSFKKKTISSQQATYDIVNLIIRNQY